MSKISRPVIRTILSATFVAGAMDILAAILVYAIVLEQTSPSGILRSIASGIFGKAALSGGAEMPLIGLLLHFLIAFVFSVFYHIIFPYLDFLRNRRFLSGVLYGIFIWIVMNLGVLPIVFSALAIPDPQGALLGMVIVIAAVGIPISYIISDKRLHG